MYVRERVTYPAKGPKFILLAKSSARESARESSLGRGPEVVDSKLLECVWVPCIIHFGFSLLE